MEFPNGLKFSEEHLWVSVSGTIATIGITKYAAEKLGNVLFVDLPHEDESIDQSESFGTLESSKTVSDLFAPVSGKVAEVNPDLGSDPEIINEFPYDDGWLMKVELTEEDELDTLLDAAAYLHHIKEEHDHDHDDDDDDEFE